MTRFLEFTKMLSPDDLVQVGNAIKVMTLFAVDDFRFSNKTQNEFITLELFRKREKIMTLNLNDFGCFLKSSDKKWANYIDVNFIFDLWIAKLKQKGAYKYQEKLDEFSNNMSL